jgi:uncharacterized DUF497 family protein
MDEMLRLGPIDLDWDDWNRDHIAKHGVVAEEVEEVVAGAPVFRDVRKGRVMAIGPTRQGRMLAVVVGPVPDQSGVYYPFSARPASRQERRRYHETKAGERL